MRRLFNSVNSRFISEQRDPELADLAGQLICSELVKGLELATHHGHPFCRFRGHARFSFQSRIFFVVTKNKVQFFSCRF